jgi:glycosyltransferase involved in cell wall biosynthesis
MSTRAITHIITGLDVGGAERALYTLLTNGLEGPYRNHIVSLMGPGHYGPLLQQAGIPVSTLNMRAGWPSVASLPALREGVVASRPDIIQGWMPHGNVTALIARHLFARRASLAWNVRLSLECEREQRFLTRAITRFNAWRSATPRAIVYNSCRARAQHEAIGFSARHAHVIPNGFNTETWRPDCSDRTAVRRELGLTEADRVIGFVGRAHHQKDVPSLFAAFLQVSSRHPEAVLVGVGRELDRFGATQGRCVLLGQRGDVPRLMRAFDVLCLSSRVEGFPNVLGEAMASGVPCVTTDVGDARAIVAETGWVVPPRDSAALAEALGRALAASREERESRGRAARTRIETEFAITAIVSRYVTLYGSILENRC